MTVYEKKCILWISEMFHLSIRFHLTTYLTHINVKIKAIFIPEWNLIRIRRWYQHNWLHTSTSIFQSISHSFPASIWLRCLQNMNLWHNQFLLTRLSLCGTYWMCWTITVCNTLTKTWTNNTTHPRKLWLYAMTLIYYHSASKLCQDCQKAMAAPWERNKSLSIDYRPNEHVNQFYCTE